MPLVFSHASCYFLGRELSVSYAIRKARGIDANIEGQMASVRAVRRSAIGEPLRPRDGTFAAGVSVAGMSCRSPATLAFGPKGSLKLQ